MRLFILLFIILSSAQCFSQKQLVVMRNEKILLRLYTGDELVFRLKGSKSVRRTYVNNLSDTSVVTHKDTITFNRIDRIYFERQRFVNRLGANLVAGGAALFLIDQANVVLVQGNDANIDSGISIASISAIAAGLPMMLVKRRYQKIRGSYKVRMIAPGSVFYKPDSRKYIN